MTPQDVFARELAQGLAVLLAFIGVMGLTGMVWGWADDVRERRRVKRIVEPEKEEE